jgi:PPOX class probable F420-dependent enzyme
VAQPGTDAAAARAENFLRIEPVVWLSTVCPDGRPHLVPIWFWWDGTSVLVASKPNARKIGNLRLNPSCMLAVGDAAADFDVALIEARAELTSIPTRTVLDAGLFRKYRDRMLAIGLERDEFEATYSQVVRITPNRCLPWRGRPREPSLDRLAMAPNALSAVPA